jgi:hypothetical protein
MKKFTLAAMLLAIGGCVWVMFSLFFLLYGDAAFSLLLFGPGYLVTIGYIARACASLSVGWRQVVWAASALVQGSWLGWFVMGASRGGFHGFAFEYLCLGWWFVAFAVSVCGLLLDRENG